MMSSKNSRRAAFLSAMFAVSLIMASVSSGLLVLVWLVLAAAEFFAVASWLAGRRCDRCGLRTRTRYLVHRGDSVLARSCVDCLSAAEWDAVP